MSVNNDEPIVPDRQESTSPIPSITLQITPQDAERFLEASDALQSSLKKLRESSITAETSKSGNGEKSPSSTPLHESIYEAAQLCEHPVVRFFLERLISSVIPLHECKAACLLFHESDKTSKIQHYFAALSADSLLTRQSAISLFRAILVAINSCVHSEESANIVVEGRPHLGSSPEEPPRKKVKREGDTITTKSETATEVCSAADLEFRQSPSFDSSLATLRDEDETINLRREIEEIAIYAADELMEFAKKAGAPKVDFATFGEWYNSKGSSIVPWLELLQKSKWQSSPDHRKVKKQEENDSPGSLLTEIDTSKTLVSFDFSGPDSPSPLLVNVSEYNLRALRHLVHRTGLSQRPASEACKELFKYSTIRENGDSKVETLHRKSLMSALTSISPTYASESISKDEKKLFEQSFNDVFSCFQGQSKWSDDEVGLREFAVGFCCFCAGDKSTKLALGFELVDENRTGVLTQDELLQYLQSYLTVLVSFSLLTPISRYETYQPLSTHRKKSIHDAVKSGASWTLGHFLNACKDAKNGVTFESFANWYSSGGYNMAPWLELLDLRKTLALVGDSESPIKLPSLETLHHYKGQSALEKKLLPRDRISSLRRHHSTRRGPPPEVLFTFPLANGRSLVVLKEDARYVRGVVDDLGLLSQNPESLWIALCKAVQQRQKMPSNRDGTVFVDMNLFVSAMQDICSVGQRKRSASGASAPTGNSIEELLTNFYLVFDTKQINSVALDELMGGLSLLCGGKKSSKLAFAFSIFDTRPESKKRKNEPNTLSGEDLFLFLKSILIVTFSCCRQSLDMTDDAVGTCITDTANLICNDVMRHQWELHRIDRLGFDEFGQWYNDGGFERAPWLELLDLKKWVLVDEYDSHNNKSKSVRNDEPEASASVIPPPPPEDALDQSFFDADTIMQMDSMDEMDMILMQPSTDKDDIASPRFTKSFSFSPSSRQRASNSLRFHVITNETHGGYLLSLSQNRIQRFREALEHCGIHLLDVETTCNAIIGKSKSGKLTQVDFEAVIDSLILPKFKKSIKSKQRKMLSEVFGVIFSAFDPDSSGAVDARELSSGFTILCRGKKSDKLEFAYHVIGKKNEGQLSKSGMTEYLQSFLTFLSGIAAADVLESDGPSLITTFAGDVTNESLSHIVKLGAEWAASQAFDELKKKKSKANSSMSFDDFADWYTTAGYSSIPWLELLDLRKWVFTAE